MIANLMLTAIIAIMGIAMGSIGIQYYNKCPNLHDDKTMKRNRNFLIAMLVISIILLIASIGVGVRGTRKGAIKLTPMAAPVAPTAPPAMPTMVPIPAPMTTTGYPVMMK